METTPRIACVCLAMLSLGIASACAPGETDSADADRAAVRDAADDTAAGAQVTGTLNYRERMLLKPGSVAEVWLLDTSRADVAATEIAYRRIESPGQQPIPFVLEYDPADIRDGMQYSVRATVRRGDELLFTTDTHYPVLTRGAGDTVELVLVRAAAAPQEPPIPDASLTNTYWKLTWVAGRDYRHEGQQREPHLKFSAADGVASGRAGCNSFTGGYETSGDSLEFATLAVTEMACIDGMATEDAFLAGLEATDRYAISGDRLTLYAGGEKVLAFEAVYF